MWWVYKDRHGANWLAVVMWWVHKYRHGSNGLGCCDVMSTYGQAWFKWIGLLWCDEYIRTGMVQMDWAFVTFWVHKNRQGANKLTFVMWWVHKNRHGENGLALVVTWSPAVNWTDVPCGAKMKVQRVVLVTLTFNVLYWDKLQYCRSDKMDF